MKLKRGDMVQVDMVQVKGEGLRGTWHEDIWGIVLKSSQGFQGMQYCILLSNGKQVWKYQQELINLSKD
jgi:hypothetical protein